MRTIALLLLAVLALTPACTGDGEDPDACQRAGKEALAAGDLSAATREYRRALEAIAWDADDPRYPHLCFGLFEARVTDAPHAVFEGLRRLREQVPGAVGEEELLHFGRRMAGLGHGYAAGRVAALGVEHHPDSVALAELAAEVRESYLVGQERDLLHKAQAEFDMRRACEYGAN